MKTLVAILILLGLPCATCGMNERDQIMLQQNNATVFQQEESRS